MKSFSVGKRMVKMRRKCQSWKECFDRAHSKNLTRLTVEEFFAVAAWWEFLREGGDDPRLPSISIREREGK